MSAATEEGYKVPPGFEPDTRQPLDDLALNDTSEIWLIQWPLNQFPEIDGKEITLKLHQDGQLGSVEDSSEKTYDVISYAAQDSDARVILPSESESKIVGKISRRVALVRYPEPDELVKLKSKTHQRSTGSSQANSSYVLSTPTKSHRQRSSQSGWGNPTSTHSSKHRSSAMSGISSDKLKSSKRKLTSEQGHHSSANLSGSSGRAISSATTVSGSSERSHKRKEMKSEN